MRKVSSNRTVAIVFSAVLSVVIVIFATTIFPKPMIWLAGIGLLSLVILLANFIFSLAKNYINLK